MEELKKAFSIGVIDLLNEDFMSKKDVITNNSDFKMEKIFWLDMEMTGLSPETDVIIEVAAIVTDKQFKELDTYHNVVKQEQKYLEAMDSWNQKCHRKTGLYDLVPKGNSLYQVEQDLLSLLEAHFQTEEKIILAGNCIYQDRSFIRKYMPQLEKKLYYRMLDVTAWKLFFEREGFAFEKSNRHRALEDTRESIREFQYYLSCFSLKKTPEKSEPFQKKKA